jgi:hypothetical protein
MIRLFLLLICSFILVNLSYAQGNLTGRVYENKTRVALAGISIENLKSHSITVSDQNGLFAIKAHIGDLITFSGFSYQTDTLYVKDLSQIEIFLDLKQNMLKGVDVTGSETKLGNLTAAPKLSPFGGQKLVYQTDADGNAKGGLQFNLFDSHSNANKKRRNTQLEKDEQIKLKITSVFSPENLKNYVPITGQEMDNFIILYTPDIDTYTSSDFNLTTYLNSCYKEFRKIPLEKRQSKQFLQLNTKPN